MSKIREILSSLPVRSRVSLTGTIVVARDIAHAKIQERLDAGVDATILTGSYCLLRWASENTRWIRFWVFSAQLLLVEWIPMSVTLAKAGAGM